MKIEKVLNNNVIQALDNNVEYIVMGKGLGFQKRVGELVDKEKIEKTFVLENTENVLYGSCIQKCCDLKEAMDHAQSNLINATIQCLNLIGCGMEIMRRY